MTVHGVYDLNSIILCNFIRHTFSLEHLKASTVDGVSTFENRPLISGFAVYNFTRTWEEKTFRFLKHRFSFFSIENTQSVELLCVCSRRTVAVFRKYNRKGIDRNEGRTQYETLCAIPLR